MREKINVMIVDDEYIVREDIKTILDWEEQGFHICCEATNGRQGLEYFRRYRPGLILADIKMPVMNGLEMAEKILELDPQAQFILLTAFDEFDFARRAMRLGISRYLLKHEIDPQVLCELLGEIRSQSGDTEKSRWERTEAFVRDLILGTAAAGDPSEKSLELPSGEGCGIYSFLLFQGDGTVTAQEVQKLAARRSEAYSAGLILEDGGVYTVLFACRTPSELVYYHSVSEYINELRGVVGGGLPDVALSERWRKLEAVREVYRRTRASLETAVFHKERGRIIQGESACSREIDHAGLYQFIMQAKSRLSSRDYEQLYFESEAYVLEECVPQRRADQFRLWKAFLIGLLEEHNEKHFYLAPSCLDGLKGQGDTVYDFLERLRRAASLLAQSSRGNLSRPMRKAVAYITEQYNRAITLEDVAEQIGMSAVYTGQIFKKEMGIPFKQYLAQVRVERAKELLQSGDYRIYEVAQMVGYQTTQYFCNVFKKATGISPAEYGNR